MLENRLGRTVKVAVDMEKGNWHRAFTHEMREHLRESADVQGNTARGDIEPGRFARFAQMAGGVVEPCFLQAEKAIESMEMRGTYLEKMVKRAGLVNAEFAVKAVNGDLRENTLRVRHPIIERGA